MKLKYKIMKNLSVPNKFSTKVLRMFGLEIGNNTFVAYPKNIDMTNISIWNGCFISQDLYIYTHEHEGVSLTIGDDVFVAPNVQLYLVTHDIGKTSKRAGQTKLGNISIGDGCWIGAGVIILPGVTIGRGCVIAAGSVVIKDVEPNSLYVSPHKIKKLS